MLFRSQGLDAEATAKVVSSVTKPRQAAPWRDLAELTARIEKLARSGKPVHLTPATASVVADQLRVAMSKPTRDEVALLICGPGRAGRCQVPCYECRGHANLILQAYGCRFEDPRPSGGSDGR